jgi:protoporphyrinogen oxidase
MSTSEIAVIGAGPMGLMCAYELLQQGQDVTLLERDDRIGGMSASFDFEGTKIERYYHFICKTDSAYLRILKDLDLEDKLRWQDTRMGFYCKGKLHEWGTPFALLKFPHLNLIQKLRYGLHALYATKIKDWRALDKVGVTDWIVKWEGQSTYDLLWHSLFHYKFYQYQHDLSASWLGTRIQRVGLSRRNIFQERLGYLEGGSDTLLNAMEKKILALGGKIKLKADVKEITSEAGQVTGVKIGPHQHKFDTVISTIPLPYVAGLTPGLSEKTKQQITDITNVGVACILFKLKKPFSRYFWMNISDQRMEVPGMIEYTNLYPQKEKILYVPYYMPQNHPKHAWTDKQFIHEIVGYLKIMKPDFNEQDVLATHVARYGFAQTVCTPNFYDKLPPMQSEIKGLLMADTAYYYPEDRSISESVSLGAKLAKLACKGT